MLKRELWSPDWSLANCLGVDPYAEVFFPTRGEDETPAREVCASCVIRSECLRYALDHHIRHGVWGGTSERERKKIRRQEREAAA